MEEKNRIFDDLAADFAACAPLPPDCGRIQSARDRAAQMSCDPTTAPDVRMVIATLVEILDRILTTPDTLDPEYVGFLRELLTHCPSLAEEGQASLDQARTLVSKLLVFHDLSTGAINPTQIKYSKTKMLGEYLVDLGFATAAQLAQALQEQKQGLFPGLRVGDILQKKSIITRAQLDQAIEQQMVDNMEMQ